MLKKCSQKLCLDTRAKLTKITIDKRDDLPRNKQVQRQIVISLRVLLSALTFIYLSSQEETDLVSLVLHLTRERQLNHHVDNTKH